MNALVELTALMPGSGTSVDPAKFPNEEFALFSIPAYESQVPDCALGREIGSSKQVVQPGDVLLSKIVPHIRRAWIVPESDARRQIGSSEWIVFRSPRFHPPYLRHVLLSDQFNSKLMQTVSGVGGSLLRARPTGVAKLAIPLPPLDEQRRIAAILDKAEELRAKRRAAIALLDQLPQAIFLEMFGDPVSNPMRWEVKRLGDLLASIESGWSPKCLDRPAATGEWGILKLGAVTKCEYLPTENKALPHSQQARLAIEVRAGDLLFTRKNTYDLVGACALVRTTPSKLMMSDLMFRLQIREEAGVLPGYIHRLLVNPHQRATVQNLAGGSSGSMPNISKSKLADLYLPVPPPELQQQFTARVDAVHRAKAAHQSAFDELDGLFASLQSSLFESSMATTTRS